MTTKTTQVELASSPALETIHQHFARSPRRKAVVMYFNTVPTVVIPHHGVNALTVLVAGDFLATFAYVRRRSYEARVWGDGLFTYKVLQFESL